MGDVAITIPTVPPINITPYAMARISERIHLASERTLDNDNFIVPNYYLYCLAIELALKAAILSKDNSPPKKEQIWKSIGHDLGLAHTEYVTSVGSDPLTVEEVAYLCQITPFYKNKGGMKYFPLEMLVQALTAYKDIPPLNHIQEISRKLNAVVASNDYYINC